MIEVRSRRVGGANYQVPTEVRPARRLALAMRWIVTGARQRSGRGMSEKLSAELLEASRGQGAAVLEKKKFSGWQKPTGLLLTIAGRNS